MTSNIFFIGAKIMVIWKQMTVITMETYPKSGNRLLGFPADEASFSSSEMKR